MFKANVGQDYKNLKTCFTINV